MIVDSKLRILSFLFILVVLFTITATFSSAYGIAPSQYSFDYNEDIDTLKLRIINSQNEDLMLSVKASGELAEYIDLSQETITLRPSENEKTIYYKITVPDDLPPGITQGYVIVKDISSSEGDGDSLVSASVEVKQKINVFSPYPDRYIDGDLFVQATDLNRPVVFSAHVKNKGKKETDVSGSIIIRTPANAEIGRVPIEQTTLSQLSAKKLRVSFNELENPGVYIAEAHINYADTYLTIKKQFMVGNKEVEASEISVDEFRLGEIVRLHLNLVNHWNQKISGVTAEVEVLDETGTIIDSSETTGADINAYDSATLDAYWDTEGIDQGTYDIAVRVLYDDVISEYYFNAAVGADSITVSSDELSGKVTGSDSGEGPDIYTIVVLLIIAIIIINISWFVLIKKKIIKK
ncbi:MAG: hypothetical protein ACQESE_05250 [Nanobdellota archaeon]